MASVEFNEEREDLNLHGFKSRSILGESTTPGMARWLMKLGLAKTERTAGMIMVVTMLVFFGVSIYFFATAG